MEILRSSGELRNTYVFFYSDNGYHLGQHRLPSHTIGSKGTSYVEDVRFPISSAGAEYREPTHREGGDGTEHRLEADLRGHHQSHHSRLRDGISLKTATSKAPFPRKFAYWEKLGARTWRAVYTPHPPTT